MSTEKTIKTMNRIRMFFRFSKYSFICFVFVKSTNKKNHIRRMSLEIDIMF